MTQQGVVRFGERSAVSDGAASRRAPGAARGDERAGTVRDTVGQVFRRRREKFGQTIDDIAADLRIKRAYLRAIEEDDYANLPGLTYALGFVRAYADHCGLDPGRMVRQFKDEMRAESGPDELDFPQPVPERRVSGRGLAAGVVIVAALGYAGWYLFGSDGTEIALTAPAADTPAATPMAPTESGEMIPPVEEDPDGAAPAAVPPMTASASGALPAPVTNEPTMARPPMQVGADGGDSTLAPRAAVAPAAAPLPTVAVAVPIAAAPTASAPTVAMAGPTRSPSGVRLPPPLAPRGGASLVAPAAAATAPPAAAPAPQDAATTPTPPAPATTGSTPMSPIIAMTPPGDAESNDPNVALRPRPKGKPIPLAALERIREEGLNLPVPAPPPQVPVEPVGRVLGATPESARVALSAIEPTLVEVQSVTGEILFSEVLKPGDTYHVPNRTGLVLTTSNAGGLEVTVDGAAAPPLGTAGEVRRNVFLNPAMLRDGRATPQ